MSLLLLLGFQSLLFGSSVSALGTSVKIQCPEGFHNIADHCIQFLTEPGSWHEMKDKCFNVGARMAKVDSDNFMYYLVKFIKENKLDGHTYWIGASDKHEASSGDDGRGQRTPFWAMTATRGRRHLSRKPKQAGTEFNP
ncbi:uncharacterized protein LOC119583075 [Penaeus monodon]|uniref:uncharacterized protein LOC119583075 n=1 Tax=Penaeus monodon TaxID=6687 RepID=UPI0018A7DBAC|nr:uncharacterized protein LOC119583075 [Penaeus monodon]